MQFKGLSWTLEAVGNCSLTRRKNNKIRSKSHAISKVCLREGTCGAMVVTGDSKAIWGKKILTGD
jgi:predicted Rdx family selenoprotein